MQDEVRLSGNSLLGKSRMIDCLMVNVDGSKLSLFISFSSSRTEMSSGRKTGRMQKRRRTHNFNGQEAKISVPAVTADTDGSIRKD